MPEPPTALVTLVDRPSVRAGDEVTIRCLVKDGDTLTKPTFNTVVVVQPVAANLQIDGGAHRATFSSLKDGLYRAYCRGADGSTSDARGTDISILPQLPLHWKVTVPDEPCVGGSERLEIAREISDKFGNIIEDALVEATITPATGFVGDADVGFRFTEDGEYAVRVEVISELDPAADIEPVEFTVKVDARAPIFEIDSPVRNEVMIAGSYEDSPVSIRGRVYDDGTPIVVLRINGEQIPVADNTFDIPIDAVQSSRWGLSIITAHAEDSCRNVGYLALPYMRTPTIYAASTTANEASRVDAAFYGQVTQSFIDDGDRSDADDIATIAQRAAQQFDVQAYIPPGHLLAFRNISYTCGLYETSFDASFRVRRDSRASQTLEFDGPYLNKIQFNDGALGFDVGMGRTGITLDIEVDVHECAVGQVIPHDAFNFNLRIGANSINAAGTFGMDLVNGEARASAADFAFTLDDLFIDLDCGLLQGACNAVLGQLERGVASVLENTIDQMVAERFPPMVQEVLQSFAAAPQVNVAGTTLRSRLNVDQLTFCGPTLAGIARPERCTASNSATGSMAMGFGMQFYPSTRGELIPFAAPGAIKGPENTVPTFDAAQTSFGVAMNYDVLNQLFWAMWYGGLMHVDDVTQQLSERLPPSLAETIKLAIKPSMPPVVMPGRGGNTLDGGIGGLGIKARLNIGVLLASDPETAQDVWIEIEGEASVILGFAMTVEDNNLKLSVASPPEFKFEVRRIDDVTYAAFAGEVLGEVITTFVAESLTGAVQQIPLPSFALGSVGNEPGDRWQMTDAALLSTGSHMLFRGSMEQLGTAP